jgi:hypothetical protein
MLVEQGDTENCFKQNIRKIDASYKIEVMAKRKPEESRRALQMVPL